MKLATAPIAGLPLRIAAISTPASKSSVWMRTVMSLPARHRRKKRDLVAVVDGRIGGRHVLVDGGAHAPGLSELLRPRAPTRDQGLAQGRHVDHAFGERELFARRAERLPQPCEIKKRHHGWNYAAKPTCLSTKPAISS